MGKTLGTILEIGGFIALAATGIGAIGDLAAFGTLAGASFGSIALGTLATAGAAALSLGASLLQKSPKPVTTETSVKQPLPARVSAYGECRRITVIIQ